MTLKEFINKTLIEKGLTFNNTEAIEKYITEKAREKESNGLAILEDEEVKEIIVNFFSDPESKKETAKEEKIEEVKEDGAKQISLFETVPAE